MASKRKSRKRRRAASASAPSPVPPPEPAVERGYARSRAKDDAARAALKPLRPGERPPAVTIGAVAAAVLALANLVALAFGFDAGADNLSQGNAITGSLLAAGILGLVAYGMWRARYWGVLGMQTLLALTLILACLALITATTVWAALLLVAIIGAAGALFWFLIKAMARIQMPERPGSQTGR